MGSSGGGGGVIPDQASDYTLTVNMGSSGGSFPTRLVITLSQSTWDHRGGGGGSFPTRLVITLSQSHRGSTSIQLAFTLPKSQIITNKASIYTSAVTQIITNLASIYTSAVTQRIISRTITDVKLDMIYILYPTYFHLHVVPQTTVLNQTNPYRSSIHLCASCVCTCASPVSALVQVLRLYSCKSCVSTCASPVSALVQVLCIHLCKSCVCTRASPASPLVQILRL